MPSRMRSFSPLDKSTQNRIAVDSGPKLMHFRGVRPLRGASPNTVEVRRPVRVNLRKAVTGQQCRSTFNSGNTCGRPAPLVSAKKAEIRGSDKRLGIHRHTECPAAGAELAIVLRRVRRTDLRPDDPHRLAGRSRRRLMVRTAI